MRPDLLAAMLPDCHLQICRTKVKPSGSVLRVRPDAKDFELLQSVSSVQPAARRGVPCAMIQSFCGKCLLAA